MEISSLFYDVSYKSLLSMPPMRSSGLEKHKREEK